MKTEQVAIEEILGLSFDIVVGASGYEERSTYFCRNYDINTKEKIVFAFNEYKSIEHRLVNDSIYKSMNYTFVNAGIDDEELVRNTITETIIALKKKHVNILVDYSSMPKLWYAAILNSRFVLNNTCINYYFVYTLANYTEPNKQPSFPNKAEPILGFAKMSIPNRPTALLIGLGYEYNRAFGLREYFDAEKTMLFYPTEIIDSKYLSNIMENNKLILENVDRDDQLQYPLLDLTYTERMIGDIIESLLPNYRIVIAPSGPKPFILISLLNAIRYNEVDIWSISGGAKEMPINKTANGKILVYRVTFDD